MELFRNMHTIVSIGARIPNDDLEFLQGRAYTSGNAKRLGYATRVPGEFFPEERDLANKIGNFYREATGRPLVPTDLTIKIDDEDIQADNKEFTTKFDEKTPEQLADEKVDRTRKAAETEALTQGKNRAILEKLQNIPEDQKTPADKIQEEKIRRSLKMAPAPSETQYVGGQEAHQKRLDSLTEGRQRRGSRYWLNQARKHKGAIVAGAVTLLGPMKFAKAAEIGAEVAAETLTPTTIGEPIQSDPSSFEDEQLLQAMQSGAKTADLTPVSDIAAREARTRLDTLLPKAEKADQKGRAKRARIMARNRARKLETGLQNRAKDLEKEYQGFALKRNKIADEGEGLRIRITPGPNPGSAL